MNGRNPPPPKVLSNSLPPSFVNIKVTQYAILLNVIKQQNKLLNLLCISSEKDNSQSLLAITITTYLPKLWKQTHHLIFSWYQVKSFLKNSLHISLKGKDWTYFSQVISSQSFSLSFSTITVNGLSRRTVELSISSDSSVRLVILRVQSMIT